MKTEGGQLYRDAIVWGVPRLEPGEAQTLSIEAAAHLLRTKLAVGADLRYSIV